LSALSLPSAAATWREVSKLPRLLSAEEEEEEEEDKEAALISPPPLFAAVNPPPPMDRPAFVARVISYRMFKSIGRPLIDDDDDEEEEEDGCHDKRIDKLFNALFTIVA